MDIYHIVRRPLVTEKGTHQTKLAFDRTTSRPGRGGSYSFEVHPGANKIEIRNAIEKIYGVKVQAVRTSARKGKQRRHRFKTGTTRQWKKAVVVLQPEFHIDLF
jgi:large subunit ribosomal protein L23